MGLAFQIAKCVAWAPGVESEQDWQLWQAGKRSFSEDAVLPTLKAIPAMQRRRLSPFAKLSLHCALEATDHQTGDLPCVFSSRHGDLNRTTKLIENVAKKEDLSPTQFGLSVHNAVSGLYSIYTKNHAPISAIAAGNMSFMVGLIDSVAKLQANQLDKILYVYTDYAVPECYLPYVDSNETISIGLLLEASNGQSGNFILKSDGISESTFEGNQALDFLAFFYGTKNSWTTHINQQYWTLNKS